eukprot:scaffold1525_cov142-Cylindrotheca_fusiformis.AAC.101
MAATTTTTTSDPWLISVKAVGLTFASEEEQTNATNETTTSGERNFVVQVSPDDALASLHDKIEGATGLKASQQRLIYRGRLIGKQHQQEQQQPQEQVKEAEAKIKDIAGLCDGQTIHLVKKRDTGEESAGGTQNAATSITSPNNNNDSSRSNLDADIMGGSSGSGGSLLAAMLGLGGSSSSGGLNVEPEESNNTNNSTSATRGTRWGWRSRSGGRSRRPHYRLTADDLEVADPGSMEPVRQSLMTLHTLLPHAQQVHSDEVSSPLQANREWYRGQWIDCRDTVNQWLEATIVEILEPDDILPPYQREEEEETSRLPRHQRLPHVANDPAISAADLEGRRRLLLEPCEPGDPDEEDGSLAGFRRRRNNDGVQMLLIHYNGWPHRWDEWIRSDSERIRPFRTRTRHPNSSTASPTPVSVFNDAPRTNMVPGEEAEDRAALLPELFRAVSVVNDLLSTVVESAPNTATAAGSQAGEGHNDLPWTTVTTSNNVAAAEEDSSETVEDKPPSEEPGYNRRQLQTLAPLLDRLGRALTDAAPHVASLANSLPADPLANGSSRSQGLSTELEGGEHPPLGGLLSLWNRRGSGAGIDGDEPPVSASSPLDPDHVDYASGIVNTSRGEVRAGPRSRAQNDDVASLLGAYLAAASLGGAGGITGGDDDNDNDEAGAQSFGRLLRERGNGGGSGTGGIDIHIQAFVTVPGGGGTGGLGLAALGGPVPTMVGGGGGGGRTWSTRDRSPRTTTSILRSRHSHTASTPSHSMHNASDDIEESGLFSELYSENPEPVNPNGSPDPDDRRPPLPLVLLDRDEPDYGDGISSYREEEEVDEPRRRMASSVARRHRRASSAHHLSSNRRQASERSVWGRLFRRRNSRSSHRDSA